MAFAYLFSSSETIQHLLLIYVTGSGFMMGMRNAKEGRFLVSISQVGPLDYTVKAFAQQFSTVTFTFTFMHLADTFIQSDLHCIQVTVFTFYQLLLSLGIEPMILALLVPCSTI